MPATTITFTVKSIRDRIKTILDADSNLSALTSSTSPPGPPNVLKSFLRLPVALPAILVDLDPQSLNMNKENQGKHALWEYHWLIKIFTEHGDIDQARDDAEILYKYVELAITNKPALQSTNGGRDGLVSYAEIMGHQFGGFPEGREHVYTLDVFLRTRAYLRGR
mgnify:FL=1